MLDLCSQMFSYIGRCISDVEFSTLVSDGFVVIVVSLGIERFGLSFCPFELECCKKWETGGPAS